ncbi:YfiR family protein [Aliiglaciecola lipolytica]|uniref:DUF4154 domain-containing protein n=1 Tax=Aliiglaciecola lipolytica E3 TaxID=1127673 RepID=K6YAS2_9ALTE|nr:YfiR family protein [Aliiglaciecola lipolytica]GAC13763.1 hypothetical protein GLIP_1122 [Aliiglaciecola lipolytica E3]
MMLIRIIVALTVTWSTIIYANKNDFEVSTISIRSTFFIHVINYSRWENEPVDLKFCLIEDASNKHFLMLQNAGLIDRSEKNINLQRVQSLSQAIEHHCHYIFVDEVNESLTLVKELKQTSLSIVTIGETASFIKNGGLMSLIEEYDKIRIYINKDQYEVSPVKFSARLLKYAKFSG